MLTHFLFVPNISPWQGWLFIAVSILTTCACVCFLRKNKKCWSWHDAPMLLLAGGLAICGTWMLELLQL
ncbi:hypothetical protein C5921_18130 [Escherichia coli O85:H32]|uniref:Uncharacterized protein n=1 Tax=Salmonella enterica subsp. enterica serovar Saintpaul TaxID=90105 RepID=A0A5U9BQH2_SALET|nr:hypothetical protein [Salmonella enterica subsp. enterica serovar Saintpaul]ECM1026424.1 hypothetical protein [Salmonella enterica subsp. enterica serovar Give]EFN8570453.1 hypothetical protein [Escherichia coli O85:H32]